MGGDLEDGETRRAQEACEARRGQRWPTRVRSEARTEAWRRGQEAGDVGRRCAGGGRRQRGVGRRRGSPGRAGGARVVGRGREARPARPREPPRRESLGGRQGGRRRATGARAGGVEATVRTMRACSPLASCEPSPKRFTGPSEGPIMAEMQASLRVRAGEAEGSAVSPCRAGRRGGVGRGGVGRGGVRRNRGPAARIGADLQGGVARRSAESVALPATLVGASLETRVASFCPIYLCGASEPVCVCVHTHSLTHSHVSLFVSVCRSCVPSSSV